MSPLGFTDTSPGANGGRGPLSRPAPARTPGKGQRRRSGQAQCRWERCATWGTPCGGRCGTSETVTALLVLQVRLRIDPTGASDAVAEAWGMLADMSRGGVPPDPRVYSTMLQLLATAASPREPAQFLGDVDKAWLALVRCGGGRLTREQLLSAARAFRSAGSAPGVARVMRHANSSGEGQVDPHLQVEALLVCGSAAAVTRIWHTVHPQLQSAAEGLEALQWGYQAALSVCARGGETEAAEDFIALMDADGVPLTCPKPWNALMAAYLRHGGLRELARAAAVLQRMEAAGAPPDARTYSTAARVCRAACEKRGDEWHRKATELGEQAAAHGMGSRALWQAVLGLHADVGDAGAAKALIRSLGSVPQVPRWAQGELLRALGQTEERIHLVEQDAVPAYPHRRWAQQRSAHLPPPSTS
eukprot:TRINITY_DN31957_c0_g1_i1.p1 TRINITY_DN31957_c0_g1~~TRINITY_DN31957_c0_g1_i1.p1  ORF type:complete len:417 (+),score=65.31 TRINITY_DN31957_c0_g1_i1:210-1460(+)